MRWALACVLVAACGGSAAHKTGPAAPTATVTPTPTAPAGPPLDPTTVPGLQIQVLLDDKLAAANHMAALEPELALTPQRLAVVSDHQHLYLVGWGGVAPVDGPAPDAFDYTADGLLLAIRGNQLVHADDKGELAAMLTLPSDGMGIVAGATTIFVYDRKPAGNRYAIYELAPGKQARRLLESPEPIDAVAQAGTHTFFASSGIAFDAVPGAPLRVVAALPQGAKVRSLAATADGKRLYVSDGDSIYAIEGERVAQVTRGLGGVLRMQANALIVLDPTHQVIARIAGLQ